MLFPVPFPVPVFDFFGKVPSHGRVIPEKVLEPDESAEFV
jgi:hypothetical protein